MAFNHGPVREFETHPIWATDEKLKILPLEGEYGHPRGWPYHPNPEVARIDEVYVLPDMVAKAIRGKNVKSALQWGEDQIHRIMKNTRERRA